MAQVKILPGTVVRNQDSNYPMSGTVREDPDPSGWGDLLYVEWSDGHTTWESPQDVTLTGKLFIEIK